MSLPVVGLLTALYRHLIMDRGKAFLLDFIGRGPGPVPSFSFSVVDDGFLQRPFQTRSQSSRLMS